MVLPCHQAWGLRVCRVNRIFLRFVFMEHHVCKGTCGAVSEQPGTCSAEGCTHKDQPFESCGCGDATLHKKDNSMDARSNDDIGNEESE